MTQRSKIKHTILGTIFPIISLIMILVVFVVEKLNFLDYNPLHWLILNNVLVLILNNKEDKAEKKVSKEFKFLRKQFIQILHFIEFIGSSLIMERMISYGVKIDENSKKNIFLVFALIFLIFLLYKILETGVTVLFASFSEKVYEFKFFSRVGLVVSFSVFSILLLLILSDTIISELFFSVLIYVIGMWYLSEDRYIIFNQVYPSSITKKRELSFLRTLLTVELISFSISKVLIENNWFPIKQLENFFEKSEFKSAWVNLILTLMVFLFLMIILVIISIILRKKQNQCDEEASSETELVNVADIEEGNETELVNITDTEEEKVKRVSLVIVSNRKYRQKKHKKYHRGYVYNKKGDKCLLWKLFKS